MNRSVSVYASTKSLYVNRTCSNSSSNQTSTRYFRNTVLWHPLCLVRACRVSSVASDDSAAGCMCQRNNIAPTVQSSPCFLPSSPYSCSFPTHTHFPPATMADSYYENQTHSPSPNGEQHSNGETYPSARIASPDGGGVSPNGYPADGGVGSTPAAAAPARKKLSSWVGFSNLPNQVHRRSVR